ncbi:MAG: SpoIIE family protein phosphatase, partial [Bacteroidota bacterium]|nr:SpoIIE family protein phosphatase [Bacteroidota bacterium]
MDEPFYIEVSCQQRNFGNERICGDVFLSRRVSEEQRLIAVLSDGMGHGVKANVLATLTATLAVNFTLEHKDVHDLAEIIMNTLPVCSERDMNYSTFSILDIEYSGETHILEYGNPQSIIMRGTEVFEPEWQCILLNSKKNAGKELRYCSFRPGKEDRIIVCSDGIVQSGTGFTKYPAGWGEGNLKSFVIEMLDANPALSARKLSAKIVNRAFLNDNFGAKDDSSCVTFYFREPRKLLICTGPPFEDENDSTLAERLRQFQGKKIVCGATTADIIAREMKVSIRDSYIVEDPGLPPVSYMDGVELVTEGILTLS